MTTEQTALATKQPELPEAVARRGITEAQWRTLANNLFPGAATGSVLMVWDYCAARSLDPMKKPCHIVPMEVKNSATDRYEWRDVVMPGIYEYRITAHRTGDYLGHDDAIYGPEKETLGVTAPEWCKFVVYRWNAKAQQKVPFPVTVFFAEVVATRKDRETRVVTANARWTRAPKQMLAKCAEAAALREAFPEEIGSLPTADEMDGQRAIDYRVIDVEPMTTPEPKSVTLFNQLPEPVRDRIEKGFAELNVSNGGRLTKLNEWFGGDGIDPEQQATALLEWMKDEWARRKSGAPRAKKASGNGKATTQPGGDGAKASGQSSPAGTDAVAGGAADGSAARTVNVPEESHSTDRGTDPKPAAAVTPQPSTDLF